MMAVVRMLYPWFRGRGRVVQVIQRFYPLEGKRWTRLINGSHIMVDLGQYTSQEIFWFGVAEAREAEMYRRLVRPDWVVLDVGANIGQYVLLAADAVGSSGHVYAFEPDPRNRVLLEANIQRNSFTDRVSVWAGAVSASSGEVYLELDSDGTRNSVKSQPPGGKPGMVVRSTSIDDFTIENNIKEINLIKIDVEGHELSVLQGASLTIARCRPHIFLEFEPDHACDDGASAKKILEMLAKWDYEIEFVSARGSSASIPMAGRGGNLFCRPKSA